MNLIADTSINNLDINITPNQPVRTHKTVVICGSCGAQEQAVDENKTECPHCDDYIY